MNEKEVSSDKNDHAEYMKPFDDKDSYSNDTSINMSTITNDDKKSLDKKLRYNRLHEQYQNMTKEDQVLFLANLVE